MGFVGKSLPELRKRCHCSAEHLGGESPHPFFCAVLSKVTSYIKVLANLTCNAQAANSLVLKSALLSWIEVQLLHSTAGSIAWIKILENILVVVDSKKIEASTNGEWRSTISRCLERLLDQKICRMSSL